MLTNILAFPILRDHEANPLVPFLFHASPTRDNGVSPDHTRQSWFYAAAGYCAIAILVC